jgi:hypothetical protein
MKSLLLAVFFAFAFSTSTFAVFNVAGMGYVISGNPTIGNATIGC